MNSNIDTRNAGRKVHWIACATLFLSCVVFVGIAQAEEMTYTPVNPSFGGNPFNGPYLLNNATQQRQFDAPERKRKPAAEQFADEIERSLISRISREISNQILGEDAQDSGTFTVGDTQVDFQRVDGQVVVEVTDFKTGGQTTIQLPAPQY